MLLVVVLVGACGSGEPEGGAPSSSTAAPTTRSTAAPTTAVPTTTIPTQSLTEYAAAYFGIAGDLASASGRALDNAGDIELYSREVAIIWEDATSRLIDLDPPPEAADRHQQALSGWVAFRGLTLAFEEGVAAGDAATAAETFSRAAFVEARRLSAIDAAMADLAAEALAGLDGPIARYMAAAWQLRARYVPVAEQVVEVLSDPTLAPVDAVGPIEGLIADLSAMSGDWSELRAPADAELLHGDQAFLIDGTVRLLQAIRAFYAGEVDELDSDLFVLNEDLTAAATVVNAGWAYATAAVLAGDEDALLAYAGAGGVDLPASPGDVFEIGVGDCFDDGSASEFRELPIVDCALPHDNEAYHVFSLDDGDFPGDSAIDAAAGERCLDEFAGFIGVPYEDSVIFASWLVPTEGSWAAGDREVICFVWHPDRKVTGTLADAGV